jgi:tetratricopeptide (TPR) repeat protein
MFWLFLVLFADQFDSAFRAGLMALNEGNLAAAESQLEAAARLQPQDARVWLALARTYWKSHKLEKAQSAARNAESFAADASVLKGLSVYYSESSEYAKAADLLQAAIARNPYEAAYYFDRAQLLFRQEKFAEALETLDAGRKQFDRSAQLELAAGVAYYGLRRVPEAIDAFLRTIQLDPSVEQPYMFLGRVVDQAEDRLPKIRDVFAALVRRQPDDYLSNYLYGKSLAMEDPARAEALVRKSITAEGQFWESHFALGVLLESKGKLEEAASEMRRSAGLNPGDPAAHYRLAHLYDRLGNASQARAERELHAKLAARSAATAIK